MLEYMLQMTACSAILYGYYHFFLRNEKFHAYNRFYLLSAMIISICLPLVKIPVQWISPVAEYPMAVFMSTAEAVTVTAGNQQSSYGAWLLFVYGLVLIPLLIRILWALARIFRLKKDAPVEHLENIRLIQTTDPDAPFSFFRWLFWNQRTRTDSAEGRHMLRHELYHIRHRHSADLLFTEVLLAVFWFNPLFYLYRRELKTIQEFLADKHATEDGDIASYAELLVLQTLSGPANRLINPFFHNQLKRRITMLLSSKKSSYQWVRKLLVLPVAVTVLALFGFRYQQQIHQIIPEIKSAVTSIYSPKNEPTDKPNTPSLLENQQNQDLKDTVPGKQASTPDKNLQGHTYKRLKEVTVIGFDESGATASASSPKIDVEAQYPGDWRKFLERNLDGQIAVKKGAPNGSYKAEIRFIVNEDGSLSDFQPTTHQGYGMEAEVIRVLKLSGRWKRGLSNKSGKTVAVKSYRVQPVTFHVGTKTAVAHKATHSNEPEIFTKTEFDARYPGNWRSFLEKNLNGQISVDNGAPPGNYTVIIQFIVDLEGNLSDIKALTNVGYGMEEEAVRVIKKSGKWKPAIQNGREVKAYRKQPITYQVTVDTKSDKKAGDQAS
ncbi:hypothetical protein GCM10027051_25660 [Niabella terrae]